MLWQEAPEYEQNFAVPGPALLVGIETDTHDVRPGAGQDGHKASVCPVNAEGVFQAARM